MAYRRTRPVYLWIALIPLVFLATEAWTRAHYRENVRLLDHTREVQTSIQDLLVNLNVAETGGRGFMLTGDESYLASLQESSARIAGVLHRLGSLTQDSPIQQNYLQILDRLVNERLELLRQTAQLGREGQNEMVRDLERRTGLAASTQLSTVVAEMMAEENRLLDLRRKSTTASELESDLIMIVGSIATILLLVWAYRIIRQYSNERDFAEAEVRRANQRLREQVEKLDRLNHQLEDRVKERTADLERSNSDLEQFAIVASHDLQEPLRMVVSFIGLLKQSLEDKLDAKSEKYMDFAVDGATRMQVLIKDLLSYAQAGSQEPVLKRTRLSDVLIQARYNLLESIRETGAEITAGPLPDLDVDPLKMSRVFQNLISNAIKFRQPGKNPRIQIDARKEADEWQVSIADDGIGFEPEYSEKIFVVFQRLNGRGKYPGTGLGLAICKRIIEGHGGRIWAESQPGSGATFHFTLQAETGSPESVTDGPRQFPEVQEPRPSA